MKIKRRKTKMKFVGKNIHFKIKGINKDIVELFYDKLLLLNKNLKNKDEKEYYSLLEQFFIEYVVLLNNLRYGLDIRIKFCRESKKPFWDINKSYKTIYGKIWCRSDYNPQKILDTLNG